MNRISQTDTLYALIIDDNDQDYTQIDTSNDNVILSGNWTDSYQRFAGDQFHLPNTGLASIHMVGGYLITTGTQSLRALAQ